MSTILPVASKTVLIGRPEYQLLLDGRVQIIHLGLEKNKDAALTAKSKVQNDLLLCLQ